MANHPSRIMGSDSGDNEPTADSIQYNFKWTTKPEKSLIFNMIRLKPCGINKHLSMLLIREKLCEELKFNIPTKCIWNYLDTHWNIEAADKLESTHFSTDDKNFTLPEEFDQLIAEEGDKIKKLQEKECLNDEINKRKLFIGRGITRSKSNSMSSVDSKDGLNEIVPVTLFQNSYVKINDIKSEEAPNTRRSLRYNDKPEEKEQDSPLNRKKIVRVNYKSDEPSRPKDLKQLNKKTPNQSKDLEKCEKVPGVRGRKRKIRNISESSFSSDNSKQTRSSKVDLTVSDRSSRSVTPEIVRGKTSNRSVTPETISRKSNLRSSDKDLKSKLALEKACIKYGHDLILPEIKIERLKPEKQFTSLIEPKSKHSMQNKNEAMHKVKGKTRGRVTSDLLVVRQSPEQPLGRRSCSTKSS